jgi:cysteine desulfurase
MINENTCIVCVMHANNETGAINNIKKIGAIAHKYNVPYYCDTAQTFNKFPINPIKNNIDAFCISFHKLHGPPGVGALVIKQQLLTGYKLAPMIFGTQNYDLRGGTENVPGIGAAYAATLYTMEDRAAKNAAQASIKKYIIDEISARMPTIMYTQYINKRPKLPEVEIVFLSDFANYLPNTILMSVVARRRKICNIELKKALEKKNIIISVGSACNTASAKASHVLYAMRADELVRKGALRISLGDHTTHKDAVTFVREFLWIVKKQLA